MATRKSHDETLDSIAAGISAVLRPFYEKKTEAEALAVEAGAAGDQSIKALVKQVAGINTELDDDDMAQVARKAAEGLGLATDGSITARTSEIKKMLIVRRSARAILAGVEQLGEAVRAHDSRQPFHLRGVFMRAATVARRSIKDEEEVSVAEIMDELRAKLIKTPPTKEELAHSLIAKARELGVLREPVGDATMLRPAAQKALDDLDAIIDGREPAADPRIAELERALDDFLSSAAADVKGFTLTDDAFAEAVGEAQDGDEPETASDTSQTEMGVPEPSGAVPEPSQPDPKLGSRKAALSPSSSGLDIDELLSRLGGFGS